MPLPLDASEQAWATGGVLDAAQAPIAAAWRGGCPAARGGARPVSSRDSAIAIARV